MANIPNPNGATFFKFFLLPHCTSQIEVPTEFVKTKGETLQPKLKLKTDVEVGKWWNVETTLVGNHCCLREGWPKFVRDVGLLHRDILVFTYLGNSSFHVSVYDGATRCKKLPLPPTIGDSGNLQGVRREMKSDPTLRFRMEVKKYHYSWRAMIIPKDFALSTGIATNRNILLRNGAGKEYWCGFAAIYFKEDSKNSWMITSWPLEPSSPSNSFQILEISSRLSGRWNIESISTNFTN